MHVAVLGAGALGGVYGVRLASRARTTVSFVVREHRVSEREPFLIERVGRLADAESIVAPIRTSSIPGDADVILLAVGTEDLEPIRPTLEASSAPIVVLTPMMPHEWNAMRRTFGERVLAAMPNVVSYVNDAKRIRYWLAPAPTRIDEPRAKHGDTIRALATALSEAGLRARLELAVHETNPATTVCFIPLGMAVALAGGLDALAKNDVLLDLSRRACREGSLLARRIGKPETFAPFASVVASGPALRTLVGWLTWRSPEVLHYVDLHFGAKLVAQHRDMAKAMEELAIEKDVPHEAIAEIARRLAETARVNSRIA